MKRFNVEIKFPTWEGSERDSLWLEETETENGSWVSAREALAMEARFLHCKKALEALLLEPCHPDYQDTKILARKALSEIP